MVVKKAASSSSPHIVTTSRQETARSRQAKNKIRETNGVQLTHEPLTLRRSKRNHQSSSLRAACIDNVVSSCSSLSSLSSSSSSKPTRTTSSASNVNMNSNEPSRSQEIASARLMISNLIENNLDRLIATSSLFLKEYARTLDEARRNESLKDSMNTLFQFFNTSLFLGVLAEVGLGFSQRMKATAASTIVTEKFPGSSDKILVIRCSTVLFTKIDLSESVKILLHEMIHACLGLCRGYLDVKHGPAFLNLSDKLNRLFNFEIPVEHNYVEVEDLAYEWICNRCGDVRIRLYNCEPTWLQMRYHAKTCAGKFIKIRMPQTRQTQR